MLSLDNKLNQEKIQEERFFVGRFVDDYFGLIIISIVFSILILVGYFFIFQKYLEAEGRYNDVKLSISEEKESLMRYKQHLVSYKSSYLAISEIDKEKIKDVIGTSPRYTAVYKTDLVINYNTLLSEKGFEVDTIDISEASGPKPGSKAAAVPQDTEALPEGVTTMHVKIKVLSVNYKSLKEIVGLLETEVRLVDINDISCETGMKSCEISFDTYFFPLPESADSDAAGA